MGISSEESSKNPDPTKQDKSVIEAVCKEMSDGVRECMKGYIRNGLPIILPMAGIFALENQEFSLIAVPFVKPERLDSIVTVLREIIHARHGAAFWIVYDGFISHLRDTSPEYLKQHEIGSGKPGPTKTDALITAWRTSWGSGAHSYELYTRSPSVSFQEVKSAPSNSMLSIFDSIFPTNTATAN